jgi:hypothetical protein
MSNLGISPGVSQFPDERTSDFISLFWYCSFLHKLKRQAHQVLINSQLINHPIPSNW